jgi:short chain dehydrogenase
VCSEPPAAQLGQLPRDDFRLRDSILKRGFGGQGFRGPVMDLQLLGKTALVTGASMGIGRAIAKGLAAEGVQVAVVAPHPLLEELASEIERGQGPRAPLIVHDIMARDAAPRLRDAALAGLGHIDILVNCAGGVGRFRSMPRRKNGKKRSPSTSPRSVR